MDRGRSEGNFEASILENVSLAPLTTLRVGGPARFFAEISSGELLLAGIRWAGKRRLPVFILGGGSNIVVSDQGFPGLVIHNAIYGIETKAGAHGTKLVSAGAGESWDDLVKFAVTQNLAGIECLSGIPGSVGATPIQNVGAYGQEVSETIVKVSALDLLTGKIVDISCAECGFGYRTSRFKTADSARFVITSVTYALRQDGDAAVRYRELRHYLGKHNDNAPTLAAVRDAVIAIRRSKAMVIDPADPDSRSVGSFFVNPVVTPDTLVEIQRRIGRTASRPGQVPSFDAPGGMVKLSAAWLIEQSGFEKGLRCAGAGLSSKHSLAIVARDGGTASEVIELAGKIQDKVAQKFGVRLVPEPRYIGFEP